MKAPFVLHPMHRRTVIARYVSSGAYSGRTKRPEDAYAHLTAKGYCTIVRRRGRSPLLVWLRKPRKGFFHV